MIVLDTNLLNALSHLGPQRDRLIARIEASGQDVAVTIINIQEAIRGWMADINKPGPESSHIRAYEDLEKLIRGFTELEFILPFDQTAATRSEELKRRFPTMGTNDRRIAAIVLSNPDCLLLSQNLRDFRRIPELQVADWLEDI